MTDKREEIKEASNEKSSVKDPYEKYRTPNWEENEFENGPLGDEKRVCRDCVCCIIFVVFLLSLVYVAVFSFDKGDPNLVLYPYDEDSHQCGKGDLKDYPYLYFYKAKDNLKKAITRREINAFCLTECPKEELNETQSSITLPCYPTEQNKDCMVTKSNYYTSKKFINRFCFPAKAEEENYDPLKDPDNIVIGPDGEMYVKYSAFSAQNSDESAGELFNLSYYTNKIGGWINDIMVSKYACLGSFIWSLAFCLIFMVFIRCCTGIIIYTLIFLVLIIFIVLGVFLRKKASDYEKLKDEKYEKAMTAFSWISFGVAFIWLVFILCMCNKIRLAVALLEATGKYIHQNCCIIFVPFLFFIITVVWYGYWCICTVYLVSRGVEQGKSEIIPKINFTKQQRYLFWYNVFALLYLSEFIKAYSQFVYASSAAIWYFCHEKKTDKHNILVSFKRGIRYHCGSLAFGSLIVAIIKFIMYFMEYIKKKVEKTVGKSNLGKCYRCLISCCQCCLNCVARTIEFINKHAYIQIAVRGKNFCVSAFEGFGLLIRNLGRFSTLILLGSFFSLFGTLFIGAASGFTGYFIVTKVDSISKELDSPIAPTVLMTFIGIIIGYVSMSVFGMSADALMHSFLLDEEINKGQAKAYPELAKFMSDER